MPQSQQIDREIDRPNLNVGTNNVSVHPLSESNLSRISSDLHQSLQQPNPDHHLHHSPHSPGKISLSLNNTLNVTHSQNETSQVSSFLNIFLKH